MAKSSSGAGGDANTDTKQGGGEEAGDRIQQQIRDFAQKAADLAQNPVARTMIAAGLVTAAAAMTSNKKIRDNVKKAGRDAVDSAEEAAVAASRIGTAVVNAAADAFRRVMSLGAEEEGGQAAGGSGEGRKAAKSASAKAKSGSKAKSSSGGAAKTGGAASKAKSAGAAKGKSSAVGTSSGGKSSRSGGRSGGKGAGSGSSGGGPSGS